MIDKAPILAIPPKAFGDKHFAAEFNKFRMFLLSLADEANKRALGYTGYLRISDAMPTVPGLYKLLDIGTYANLVPAVDGSGNPSSITAVDGKISEAYYDGVKWVNSKITLPGATAAPIFDPTDNTNPSTMKATADRYDPILQSFINNGTAGPEINGVQFTGQATGNTSIYGIAVSTGILRSDNTVSNYSESGYYFYNYKNIPTIQGNKRITRVEASVLLFGNSGVTPSNVTLIGVKENGTLRILIDYKNTPPPNTLQNFSIDVSDFKYLSFGFFINSNPDSANQTFKFHLKSIQSVNDGVFKFINDSLSSINNDIDLIKFGCVGDGVTDDTAKFNEAIVLAMATGRKIYGRSNKYKVSKLTIPKSPTWTNVEIYGDSIPVPTYGTIGSVPEYSTVQKGMMIISDYVNGNEGVIYAEPLPGAFQNFSFVFIALRNLTIRTSDNPKTCGVMAFYAVQLMMENVFIDTGVYNVQSLEPTFSTTGIVMPSHSNGAFSYLRNVYVSGYANGVLVFEHTDGDNVILHSCKNALVFRFAEHATYFKRVLSQRCQNVVKIEGKCRFEIAQLNCEYVGSGQSDSTNSWQKTQYELLDPGNNGVGRITYANSRGAMGANDVFRMNGGGNIIVKYIGNDTRLTGAGIPDPNPIL